MTLSRPSYSPSRGPSILVLALVAGCGAADTRVDPGDLALRDLLGVAPTAAVAWDTDQRAAARRVLMPAIADDEPLGIELGLGAGVGLDERVARALAALDGERDGDGEPALGVVRVAVLSGPRALRVSAAVRSPDSTGVELRLSAAWDAPAAAGLATRAPDMLVELARRAGHPGGPLLAVPAPRLATVAAYIDAVASSDHAGADGSPHLLVNPVLLAALEPEPEAPAAAALVASARPAAGNPYSFYGSVAECAQAQRLRCDACVPTGDCVAITDSDGATECARLAEDGGRGYFLLCINLSLAITGIAECAADGAPACPRDEDASRTLAELAQNASFLDDATCSAVLDGCLADLYGEPDGDFPTPGGPDAGPDPAPVPRDPSVGCGDSSANCELDPSCNVTGPSCDNSVTCDGGCSDSSSQSGCDGTCDACESNDGDGGSCVSCESDDSTSSEGGSCDSGDGGSEGGGSCDSGDGGSGGDCGGGDCGGGDCGSNGGCGDCDSGGSSGSCSVAHRKRPPAGLALTVALLWAFLPVPLAARARRRARRTRAAGGAR
jgi:hypothetical protein